MTIKHFFWILLITFLFGSSYPVGKIIFNNDVPPLLMGSLRMLIVFIVLLPFIKFQIPKRKYWIPLLGFGFFMGFATNVFLNLSILMLKPWYLRPWVENRVRQRTSKMTSIFFFSFFVEFKGTRCHRFWNESQIWVYHLIELVKLQFVIWFV